MTKKIIDVFRKVMLCDTPAEEVESKLQKIMAEVPLYYSKKGAFSFRPIWLPVENDSLAPYQFYEAYGADAMPVASKYLMKISAVIVNQTSAERGLKAYKFVNSKYRTSMGSLTTEQFTSSSDEYSTRGIIAAQVYMRAQNNRVLGEDDVVMAEGSEKYAITDLDKKDWALVFKQKAPEEHTNHERVVLSKVEAYEQPTKKNNDVHFKLQTKYINLVLRDREDDEDDSDDSDESGNENEPSAWIFRKVESVIWKKGAGNSYVVVAYDLIADGKKMDREKPTEYKIDSSLSYRLCNFSRLQQGRCLYQRW